MKPGFRGISDQAKNKAYRISLAQSGNPSPGGRSEGDTSEGAGSDPRAFLCPFGPAASTGRCHCLVLAHVRISHWRVLASPRLVGRAEPHLPQNGFCELWRSTIPEPFSFSYLTSLPGGFAPPVPRTARRRGVRGELYIAILF